MNEPLISVLVPVYNDSAFLDATLSSVASQTFRDFEVIIADDASQDGSVSIASRWASADVRFKLTINPRNLGMTANWNQALSIARAPYVLKLDADDVMRPRILEVLLEEMERDSEVYAAYCRTLSCDENLEPFASYLGDRAFVHKGMDPLVRYVRPGQDFYNMSFSDIQLWCSNAQMHRRQNLLKIGGWDATWGCASDTDLILRVLEQGRLICHNPYTGILYRHRAKSVSDNFRKHGWLVWEGLLIHLLSLNRYHQSGGVINDYLRKSWWRFWHNWIALCHGHTSDLSAFPETVRANLARAAAQVTPPPRRVRLEGWTRQKLWAVKGSVARKLSLAVKQR